MQISTGAGGMERSPSKPESTDKHILINPE